MTTYAARVEPEVWPYMIELFCRHDVTARVLHRSGVETAERSVGGAPGAVFMPMIMEPK